MRFIFSHENVNFMHFLLWGISGKILALIVGIIYFRYLPVAYRILLFQICFAIVCESYGRYLVVRYHETNLWVFSWYRLIGELWLMSGVAGLLVLNPKIRKLILYSAILGTAIWVSGVFLNGLNSFTPWSIVSIYIVLVITYLCVLFDSSVFKNVSLVRQPSFWLSISILLFVSCNIPLYSLFNQLNTANPELLKKLFNITLALNFVRYPLVAVAFFLIGKNSQRPEKATTDVI